MDCCSPQTQLLTPNQSLIALVGNPNVGKSVFFHRLTGLYAPVSNYPGTTVEIARGAARAMPSVTIIDTPGIISFPPRTEDEEVTAKILLQEKYETIVQVGDAKNLRRTLLLNLQLAEMGVPLVLALNMMDEAHDHGIKVDASILADHLGIPVIPTVATRGKGIQEVIEALGWRSASRVRITYPELIEQALSIMDPFMPQAPIHQRALSLLWLCGDRVSEAWMEKRLSPEQNQGLHNIREDLRQKFSGSLVTTIQQTRLDFVEQILSSVLKDPGKDGFHLGLSLGRLATHPLWGLPLLALVLYGIYWFVGVFGAGTLVGLIEERLFGGIINPWVVTTVQQWIPFKLLADFLVGEYGVWTMGITYAAALLLPIVTTFFITFGILEDSGYLPRLSVLSNRLFKIIGLNGKAVLPMVLGLGCVTMATLTTRILENKRDRFLVILLLALAVPCSAQLGVVMGMLAGISLTATLIWGGVVTGILLLVGWLAARLMPGERTALMVELPPLRLPVFSNVLLKTAARIEWYIKEAVPLFIAGTILLFTLDALHILPWIIKASEPLISGWLGLPPQASSAFLIGFLRRDFAATGLFAMQSQGLLSPIQVVVAIVTITLFIPCIASIFMIAKERGPRTAVAMIALIFPLAFFIGGLLQRVLLLFGWGI